MTELARRLEVEITAAARGKLPELATLRLLKAALANEAIARRQDGAVHELSELEALAVVRREVKKRQEAAEIMRQAGRQELADNETTEASILSRYLPPAPSDEAVSAAVAEAASQLGLSGPQAIGPLTKAVMTKFSGAVDGGTVSRAVKTFLSR